MSSGKAEISESKNSKTPNKPNSYLPIFVNWFSSVTCVLANKYVLQEWKHTFFLTALHFTFTFLSISCLLFFDFFKFKRMSIGKIIPLSLLLLGSIAFNNLSIQFNPIGFYQVMKIAVVPVVAFIEIIFLKYKLTLYIFLSLIIMLTGIMLISVISLKTDILGFLIALAGTITTALYQILPKQLQLKEGCDEYQLLLFQTPISAAILFLLVPFEGYVDRGVSTSILNTNYTKPLIIGIAVTTFMSAFINVSTTIIIKRTSALTFCVASQLKTISILLGGFIFFREPLTVQKIIGVVLALAGIVWYSFLKYFENSEALKAKAVAQVEVQAEMGGEGQKQQQGK